MGGRQGPGAAQYAGENADGGGWKVMHHKEGCRQVRRQALHQADQRVDASGRKADYNDIVTGHADLRLPGTSLKVTNRRQLTARVIHKQRKLKLFGGDVTWGTMAPLRLTWRASNLIDIFPLEPVPEPKEAP
jgi:hypothetical protein